VVEGSGAGAGRSTAIVLFTDLVGSTELRSRLGEDAAEVLRHQHDGLVTGVVEANRGRLVKHLGDGVMASFTGASNALAAAVGIQQALDRHNRSGASGVPLEVRIGVSAGDVAFEEADCFGTPVIEAARLCAAATGGQILVTEVVRLLAGTAGGHELRPVGPLDLKGLPAPVSACEVAWEPLPAPSLPMPALLTDIGRIFVGRDRELERLEQLWKEVAAGELRVAFLPGEPGVGKTRLAAELAREVHEEGATVLAGRCDEDLGVPYQPFVEALRHFLDFTPDGDLPQRLGRYGGELTRLVPELTARVPDLPPPLRSDPETERYRLFDGVAAWLAALSADRPLLLVLDDLQWAAKPTLLLLRHVIRSSEPVRLFLLATYRDTEVSRTHPLAELLADLRGQTGVERISLTGLDSAGVVAYMERAAGYDLDEEDLGLAHAIHEETEGNPFFVRELLRHLTETGGLTRRDGRWFTRLPIEELGIPEGVREVVARRLSRLSAEANRVLQMAAVAGTEFALPVVRDATGLDEGPLITALEEAIGARLVTEAAGPSPRYRFAHVLVRDTLYSELSAARRVTLHRRVAEAIETVHGGRLDDHLPALAHHYARAAAPTAGMTKAFEYARRAGDRALAQLAHDEAVAYYRQALELLGATEETPDDAQRLEVLIALGEAERRAGEPAYRATLLEAARLAQERGDVQDLARAALANTRGTLMSAVGSVDDERVAVLEAALEALSGDDLPIRARLLATLGLELTFSADRERRLQLSDEALALARRSGDPATLVHVLSARYQTINAPTTLPECLANTAELVEAAERVGEPAALAWARGLRVRAAMESGHVEEAREILQLVKGSAGELGQPTLRWLAAYSEAALSLVLGRIEEAEGLADEAAKLAQATGQPDGPMYAAAQQFGVRFDQGRLEEVRDVWVELVARKPDFPVLRAMLALLYCELDWTDEAKRLFEDLAASDFADIPLNFLWSATISYLAAVAARLGDRLRAGTLYQLLAPHAGQIAGRAPLWDGSVSYYLGMLATTLGHDDQAEERFAAAEATHERIPAPAWLARSRLEWARMLLARPQPGDAARAQELLGQALSTARELGLGNVERRAVELLKR
jgi:class 3 adenylate cyclase/tetratricopeptide (TPR) repeat protein